MDEKIAQAWRHVESGRRIIEQQRVICLRNGGKNALELLEQFERSQQIFEADLETLLNIKDKSIPPAR